MRKRRLRSQEDSEIDLTPMLDVVFIMLIFFIVTASFVKEPGIEVIKPAAQTSQQQKDTGIIVAIDEANQIWINRKQVVLGALRGELERLLVENPEGGAVVQADKRTSTGMLVRVMDQIRLAGIERIAVSTEKAR